MRTRLLVGAAALALLMSPATASPPAGSRDQPVGRCGMVAAFAARPPSDHFEGVADCEAVFHAKNFGLPTTIHALVTLVVQTSSTPNSGSLASCTFTSSAVGAVVVGACRVSFNVTPSQPVWLCVRYTWDEGLFGNHAYDEDFDPVIPGRQCALAVRTSTLIVA